MTRVLVVEDEESYRDALAYMLRKEGFDVVEAADGTEGLAEYDRVGADIVLLDLMMPGLPGHRGLPPAAAARSGAGDHGHRPRLARSTRWSGWSSAPTTT